MSASRTDGARWLCLLVCGCRFGGPSGEASVVSDDPAEASTAVDGGPERSVAEPPLDQSVPEPPPDASSEDGRSEAAASLDGSSEAPPAPADGGCNPPFESAVCDPVCNTGCPALLRCDVADVPETGTCIGIWIAEEGSSCLRTAVTDPCAAGLACVDGTCRRLCYRDGDCTAPGTCCTTSIEVRGAPSGFRICAPCAL
jgi:hypothetical protein